MVTTQETNQRDTTSMNKTRIEQLALYIKVLLDERAIKDVATPEEIILCVLEDIKKMSNNK